MIEISLPERRGRCLEMKHSVQDQAMGSKDPNDTGGSRHLYDSLGGPPVDPRGTLSEAAYILVLGINYSLRPEAGLGPWAKQW